MLIPEMGASKVMNPATSKPAQTPVLPRDPRRVGDGEHDGHEPEGDPQLGQKRRGLTAGAGDGDNVVDGRVRDEPPRDERDEQNAASASNELRHDVEERVGRRDSTEAEEGQGHGGVEVRARLLAPGRVDQSYG